MIITKHAKLRIKERLGLPKRAHDRHISRVLKNGLLHSRVGFEKFKVIYHGFLYIFALDKLFQPVLITAYHTNNNICEI